MESLGALGQVARRVAFLGRGRTFLRDRLGVAELYAFPGPAFLDLGGPRLMLSEAGRKGEADLL